MFCSFYKHWLNSTLLYLSIFILLFYFSFYFIKIHSEYRSNQDAYLIQLENLVAQLPVVNYTLLKHLCQFLHRVSVYQSDNKMSIESLGIVFGPNVFRFTPENLVSFLLRMTIGIFCLNDVTFPALVE